MNNYDIIFFIKGRGHSLYELLNKKGYEHATKYR